MLMWLILLVSILCAHSNAATITEGKGLSNIFFVPSQSSASWVSTDNENALEQQDLLSLVTRYAGVGYNIIKGNPEGDFDRGGVDPVMICSI